jgi:hypothetical protein
VLLRMNEVPLYVLIASHLLLGEITVTANATKARTRIWP